MNEEQKLRKQHAERMMPLFYKKGEFPAPEFVEDLKRLVQGKAGYDEVMGNIITRSQKAGKA